VASPEHTTAGDFSLPTLDLRLVARRATLPLALAATALAVVLLAGGPLGMLTDALGRALSADPRWIALAAVAELLSFGGYIALFWLVGRRATPRLDLRAGAEITLGGAAATRLLPTAGAGGAALTLWALRRSGLGTRQASRTLLTFLVLMYSVFLGSIAVTGTLLAVEGESVALTALPAALAMVGILIPLSASLLRDDLPGKLGTAASVLGGAVRDAVRHARSFDPRLLGAFVWWGFDMAVLYGMLNAFGTPPAFAAVVLAYFLGQVGNTIPVPGAVSGGMVGALIAFGVDADLAIVSVLSYRAIAIWLPAPIGLVQLGSLRRTMARWGSEDALAVESAASVPVVAEGADVVPFPYERRSPWQSREASPAAA
jgi:putative heme transporter